MSYIQGAADSDRVGRPKRPSMIVSGTGQTGDAAASRRVADKEISTQTPTEMRRIMKRQEGRARKALKSSRRFVKR